MSAEWIEISIDDEKLKSDTAMQYARQLINKHSIRCCRILAYAVLDIYYLIQLFAS